MYIRSRPKHGNNFLRRNLTFTMLMPLSSLRKDLWLYLSSLQILKALRALVKASCQREVESHPPTSRPLANRSLAPLLICPSVTLSTLCHERESAYPSPWMTHSENWTSSRKILLFSWKRTAGMGRSQRAVTLHWLYSTRNTSRSASFITLLKSFFLSHVELPVSDFH